MFVDKYSALRDVEDDALLEDIFGPEQPLLQPSLDYTSLPTEGAAGPADALPSGFVLSDLLDSSNLAGIQLQGKYCQALMSLSFVYVVLCVKLLT